MKMARFTEPLVVATVNAVPVRFFAPPDGQPAFAWAAVADVRLAARLPDARNPTFLSELRRDAGDDTLRVATPDGIETIAAFWIGRALFDGAVLIGAIDRSVARAFTREAAIATSMLIDMRRDTLDGYLSEANQRQEAAMARFLP